MQKVISHRACAAMIAILIGTVTMRAGAVTNVSQGVVAHRSNSGKSLVATPQIALTNDGDLYFTYLTPDENGQQGEGNMALVRKSDPTQIVSVWASTNKGARLGRPAINTALNSASVGDLAFTDVAADGTPIMVTRSAGGAIITIRGENFSAWNDPTWGSQNRIYFTGTDNDGLSSLQAYDRSAGSIITIVGFRAQAPLGTHHLMVGNGDVIRFRAADQGSTAQFIAEESGGSIVTIYGNNFGNFSDPGGRGDNLVFSYDDGAESTIISQWGHNLSKPIIANIRARVISPTGNSSGVVVYGLGSTFGTPAADDMQSIYWTNTYGENPTEIIALGDVLDGSAVTKLSFSADSLNDNGQFAYYAQLADGSEHLYVTEALPEPTSAMLVIIGSGMMMRRRGRNLN